MRTLLWSVSLGVVLCSACVQDVPAAEGGGDEDVGAAVSGETLAHLAPSEVQLCAIVFGVAGRAQVERELGAPDSTRETLDRVVMLYSYEDGVTLAFHLDADVFRDFSVYGGRVPRCWADAKRKTTQVHARTDAGVDAATD